MRLIFLGTPDFAIPALRAIHASGHQIIAVITQPDKEGKRLVMTPPAVKVEAEALGLPVYQFASLRKEGVELVRSLSPDVMVTAAFGQILSQVFDNYIDGKCVNDKASLLDEAVRIIRTKSF